MPIKSAATTALSSTSWKQISGLGSPPLMSVMLLALKASTIIAIEQVHAGKTT